MKCKSLDEERETKGKQTVSKENESGKQPVSCLQIAGLLALLDNCLDSLWLDRFILDRHIFPFNRISFLILPSFPICHRKKKNILSLFLSVTSSLLLH